MLPLLVSASPRRVQGVSGAPSPRVPPQNPARGRARAPVPLLWRSLQPRARPHGDCRLHSNLIHSHSDILSRVLASSPWRRSASPKLGTQRDIDDLRCLCVQVITMSTAPAVAPFLVLQARCARAFATPVCAPARAPLAAPPPGPWGSQVCACVPQMSRPRSSSRSSRTCRPSLSGARRCSAGRPNRSGACPPSPWPRSPRLGELLPRAQELDLVRLGQGVAQRGGGARMGAARAATWPRRGRLVGRRPDARRPVDERRAAAVDSLRAGARPALPPPPEPPPRLLHLGYISAISRLYLGSISALLPEPCVRVVRSCAIDGSLRPTIRRGVTWLSPRASSRPCSVKPPLGRRSRSPTSRARWCSSRSSTTTSGRPRSRTI